MSKMLGQPYVRYRLKRRMQGQKFPKFYKMYCIELGFGMSVELYTDDVNAPSFKDNHIGDGWFYTYISAIRSMIKSVEKHNKNVDKDYIYGYFWDKI